MWSCLLNTQFLYEPLFQRSGKSNMEIRDVPRRCSPKVNLLVGGFVESQRANRENKMPTTSTSMCTASVIMAKLFDTYPPVSTRKCEQLKWHFLKSIYTYRFIQKSSLLPWTSNNVVNWCELQNHMYIEMFFLFVDNSISFFLNSDTENTWSNVP